MSYSRHVTVEVQEINEGRRGQVLETVKSSWDYLSDWDDDDDPNWLQFSGDEDFQCNEQVWVNALTRVVWIANGGYCPLLIEIGGEDYEVTRDDFDRNT